MKQCNQVCKNKCATNEDLIRASLPMDMTMSFEETKEKAEKLGLERWAGLGASELNNYVAKFVETFGDIFRGDIGSIFVKMQKAGPGVKTAFNVLTNNSLCLYDLNTHLYFYDEGASLDTSVGYITDMVDLKRLKKAALSIEDISPMEVQIVLAKLPNLPDCFSVGCAFTAAKKFMVESDTSFQFAIRRLVMIALNCKFDKWSRQKMWFFIAGCLSFSNDIQSACDGGNGIQENDFCDISVMCIKGEKGLEPIVKAYDYVMYSSEPKQGRYTGYSEEHVTYRGKGKGKLAVGEVIIIRENVREMNVFRQPVVMDKVNIFSYDGEKHWMGKRPSNSDENLGN